MSVENDLNNVEDKIIKMKQENEDVRRNIEKGLDEFKKELCKQNDLEDEVDSLQQKLSDKSKKMQQTIINIENKYSAIKNDLEYNLDSVQSTKVNVLQENQHLINSIKNLKDTLSQQASASLHIPEVDVPSLIEKREKLYISLEAMKHEAIDLNNEHEDLNQKYLESCDTLEVLKDQLNEKKEIQITINEQLKNCKAELNELALSDPNNQSTGDSLFSEVDQKHKNIGEEITSLSYEYLELKKINKIQKAEIYELRSKAMAHSKKQEDEAYAAREEAYAVAQQLLNLLKKKILDLESKLKKETSTAAENLSKMQLDQHKMQDFDYLESVLAVKNKEIEQLESKMGRNSIVDNISNQIKQEKSKSMLTQAKYWHNRALCLQGKITEMKNQMKSENMDIEDLKIMLENLELP
ncbi:putative leucine-rich repeat-containing protein DDB_G0290503 [Prorops nasuta]|uniref:putative leucine-rich repeat-containing protein DDB_G0290503 n=1 Tax=Prorops nasuta TaxID=863751 RepID=UPI0034CD18BC